MAIQKLGPPVFPRTNRRVPKVFRLLLWLGWDEARLGLAFELTSSMLEEILMINNCKPTVLAASGYDYDQVHGGCQVSY